MIHILSFLVFLVLQGAKAQDCVPDSPTNVTLSTDNVLRWEGSTNCPNTLYMIYIHIDIDNLQYIYTANALQLYLPLLPACERFYFEVSAFVGSALSEPARLVAYSPAPADVDLTIETFTASVEDGATFLTWRVPAHFAHCANSFRVVVLDLEIPEYPRDIYTERNNMFLNDLIPCGRYQFVVMAIYDLETEGPAKVIFYTEPQEISPLPFLESVHAGDTYVSINWSLPSYSVNRCTITGVDFNGLPFYQKYFPVDDTPERPLFTTNLTELLPENMYMFKVSIENIVGPSAPLPIGVQTLPLGSG